MSAPDNQHAKGFRMYLFRRLRSAWQRYSLLTFTSLVARNIYFYGKEIFSGRLFTKLNKKSKFDIDHNTETEKICEIGSLNIDSVNIKHAKRYQPSPQVFTTKAIGALSIDHHQFTFLDYGAGKGRVLLIAAQLPFSAVVGIEFSKELCNIALENIEKLSKMNKVAKYVTCVHEDATRYSLPDTPLVCYFYNPFDQLVMQAVIDKLVSSFLAKQREIYIIYAEPRHRDIIDKSAYFDVVEDDSFHVTYRSRHPK